MTAPGGAIREILCNEDDEVVRNQSAMNGSKNRIVVGWITNVMVLNAATI